MPTTKKAKITPAATTKKAAKTKTAKKSKPAATKPVDWSHAIAKAAEQKRTQASWPGTGESWKKKVRI
jgi:hypothetical protein